MLSITQSQSPGSITAYHAISARSFICTLFMIFNISAWVFSAEPFTAMTTRETPYYTTLQQEKPQGTLPPYVTLLILDVQETNRFMTISFDTASGKRITALVEKALIDASFYATPTPSPAVSEQPVATRTPLPSATPTPFPANAQRITLTKRIPAYDIAYAQRLIGYFPQGVDIYVLSNGPSASSYVAYTTANGREILALCRNTDIQQPATLPTAAGRKPAQNEESSSTEWLENHDGYKQALSLQRSTKNKILIYFHTAWNKDCERLSEQLLFTGDFINASKDIIKVRINPEYGKQEAELAAKFDISILPSILMLDAPGSEPRKIKLLKKMYGNVRVVDIPKALAIIRTTQ